MGAGNQKIVVTFHSHFEAVMMKRRLGGKLIPVPRSLSSSCGSALELESEGFSPEMIKGDHEAWWIYDGKEYINGEAYQHGEN